VHGEQALVGGHEVSESGVDTMRRDTNR